MKGGLYEYPPVEQWRWKSYDGKNIVSADEFISEHQQDEFYIGTDSHPYWQYCLFTTALIAYKRGTGGYIIISSQKTSEKGSMRPRLISEAMRSLAAAYYLDPRIPPSTVISIHLDVNPNIEFKSNQCMDTMVGIIMSQGKRFRPVWKPDSWAASSAADRKT